MSDSRFLTIKNDGITFVLPDTAIDRLGFNLAQQMTDRGLMEWQALSDDDRREKVVAAIFGSIPAGTLRKAFASTINLPADEVFIPRKKAK